MAAPPLYHPCYSGNRINEPGAVHLVFSFGEPGKGGREIMDEDKARYAVINVFCHSNAREVIV